MRSSPRMRLLAVVRHGGASLGAGLTETLRFWRVTPEANITPLCGDTWDLAATYGALGDDTNHPALIGRQVDGPKHVKNNGHPQKEHKGRGRKSNRRAEAIGWLTVSGETGCGDDCHHIAADGSTGYTATWTFSGLDPAKQYQVLATEYGGVGDGPRNLVSASVEGAAELVASYAYHALGRLLEIEQTGPGSDFVADKRVTLEYDAAGCLAGRCSSTHRKIRSITCGNIPRGDGRDPWNHTCGDRPRRSCFCRASC